MSAVTEVEKARIVGLCRAGGSCREVAAQVGRSTDTVSRVARAAGVTFARVEQTEMATRVRVASMVERRTAAAEGLLDDLADGRTMLASAESPRDFRDAASGLAALATAHHRLVDAGKGDSSDGIEQGRSLIGDLARGLSAVVAEMDAAGAETSGE